MNILPFFVGVLLLKYLQHFRRTRRKFQDTIYPLNVTLEEVYVGKTAKLRLSKKELCSKCKGYVVMNILM